MFPITDFVVEDIAAVTKNGKRRWNVSFSPLEVGKKWFYTELFKLGKVHTLRGYETKELRDRHGLKKSNNKLSNNFSAIRRFVVGVLTLRRFLDISELVCGRAHLPRQQRNSFSNAAKVPSPSTACVTTFKRWHPSSLWRNEIFFFQTRSLRQTSKIWCMFCRRCVKQQRSTKFAFVDRWQEVDTNCQTI